MGGSGGLGLAAAGGRCRNHRGPRLSARRVTATVIDTNELRLSASNSVRSVIGFVRLRRNASPWPSARMCAQAPARYGGLDSRHPSREWSGSPSRAPRRDDRQRGRPARRSPRQCLARRGRRHPRHLTHRRRRRAEARRAHRVAYGQLSAVAGGGSSPGNHRTTTMHRRRIKLTRALSRNRLVPGRGPRSRSLRKPRAPAAATVPGPVVGFGSWSDPDPHPGADPDPPSGTRDLPGHHPRAGHSRARASLNGQHSGVQRQVLSDPHLEPDQIGHPCSRSRRPPPHAAIL